MQQNKKEETMKRKYENPYFKIIFLAGDIMTISMDPEYDPAYDDPFEGGEL